jgi:hypothetical protein
MMGPSRSLKLLSQQTGFKLETLRSWQHEFGWLDRLAEKDKKAVMLIEKENEQLYVDTVKLRHQSAYQQIAEKALKQIGKKKINFESDKDAAIALDIAIKGERQVLGLSDSKLKAAIAGQGFAALVEAVLVGH